MSVPRFAPIMKDLSLKGISLTARPKISEVVQDTKILLQQSRERLVISYVYFSLRKFRPR